MVVRIARCRVMLYLHVLWYGVRFRVRVSCVLPCRVCCLARDMCSVSFSCSCVGVFFFFFFFFFFVCVVSCFIFMWLLVLLCSPCVRRCYICIVRLFVVPCFLVWLGLYV